METTEVIADNYTGLISSIVELTREIENLDAEPSEQPLRKVLWAKKRFPRQGIRCVGKIRSKRRMYIGATAKDFPWRILNRNSFTSPQVQMSMPPKSSETFQREGSTETFPGTESSTSDPTAQSARNVSPCAQTPGAELDGVGSSSANNGNDVLADGSNRVEFLSSENLYAIIEDTKTCNDMSSSIVDDDSSIRAMNITGDDGDDCDESVDSFHFDGNSESFDEAFTTAECVDCQDNDFENTNRFSPVSNLHEAASSDSTTIIPSVRGRKRKTPKRAQSSKRPKGTECREVIGATSSSQESESVIRKSRRKASSRAAFTAARGSQGCRGGKHCVACGDFQKSSKSFLPNVQRSSESPEPAITAPVAPPKAKDWTKKEWNEFFDVFTAVAAEVHTLQSMKFDNTTANQRWLRCMRTILQRPPF